MRDTRFGSLVIFDDESFQTSPQVRKDSVGVCSGGAFGSFTATYSVASQFVCSGNAVALGTHSNVTTFSIDASSTVIGIGSVVHFGTGLAVTVCNTSIRGSRIRDRHRRGPVNTLIQGSTDIRRVGSMVKDRHKHEVLSDNSIGQSVDIRKYTTRAFRGKNR